MSPVAPVDPRQCLLSLSARSSPEKTAFNSSPPSDPFLFWDPLPTFHHNYLLRSRIRWVPVWPPCASSQPTHHLHISATGLPCSNFAHLPVPPPTPVAIVNPVTVFQSLSPHQLPRKAGFVHQPSNLQKVPDSLEVPQTVLNLQRLLVNFSIRPASSPTTIRPQRRTVPSLLIRLSFCLSFPRVFFRDIAPNHGH